MEFFRNSGFQKQGSYDFYLYIKKWKLNLNRQNLKVDEHRRVAKEICYLKSVITQGEQVLHGQKISN